MKKLIFLSAFIVLQGGLVTAQKDSLRYFSNEIEIKENPYKFYYNGIGYTSQEKSPYANERIIGENETLQEFSENEGSSPIQESSIMSSGGSCLVSILNISTGHDQATSTALDIGDMDGEWIVVSEVNTSNQMVTPRVSNVIQKNASWYPEMHQTRWISVHPSDLDETTGDFTFQYEFCLNTAPTGNFDIQLIGLLRSDNISDVKLNTYSILSTSSTSFKDAPPATFVVTDKSKFVSGTNTLEILLHNPEHIKGFNLRAFVSTYQNNSTAGGSAGIIESHINEGACCSSNGTISGIVYDDLAGTPTGYDIGDDEHVSSVVTLTSTPIGGTSTIVATQNTGTYSGFYSFVNVTPGNYEVKVDPIPTGSVPISPVSNPPIYSVVSNGEKHRLDFDIAKNDPSPCSFSIGMDYLSGEVKCPGEASNIGFNELKFFTDFVNAGFSAADIIGYRWYLGGNFINNRNFTHWFQEPGYYTIFLVILTNQSNCPQVTLSLGSLYVPDCSCNDCVPSFSPSVAERYVLSAWVKQENNTTGEDVVPAAISFEFEGVNQQTSDFIPKGPIIDGWQRIEEVFTIPDRAEAIITNLKRLDQNIGVYFDDIRIHPFDASLKSYVYDPITGKLIAEQNEQNYSTFYEYDQEGKLVRIKKETERGIKTITETHQTMKKSPQ